MWLKCLSVLIEVLLQQTRRNRNGDAPAVAQGGPPVKLTQALTQPLAQMPAVDAIDVDEAIARLGGDTTLYAAVLASYLAELKTMPDQLDALLASGDAIGAGRLLHTVKGLSATVGATYLAAVVAAAEQRLKTDNNQGTHDRLRAEFRDKVMRALRILEPVVYTHVQKAAESVKSMV